MTGWMINHQQLISLPPGSVGRLLMRQDGRGIIIVAGQCDGEGPGDMLIVRFGRAWVSDVPTCNKKITVDIISSGCPMEIFT